MALIARRVEAPPGSMDGMEEFVICNETVEASSGRREFKRSKVDSKGSHVS